MKTITLEPSSSQTHTMPRPCKALLGNITFDTSYPTLKCFIEPQTPSYRMADAPRQTNRREQTDVKACGENDGIFDEKSFLCSVLGQLFEEDGQDINYSPGNNRHSDGEGDAASEMEELRRIFNCENQALMQGKKWEDYKDQQNSNHSTRLTALSPDKEETSSTYHSSDSNREDPFGQQAYIYYQNLSLYHQLQRKRRSLPTPAQSSFSIDSNAIERDGRTTLMIRHIPNKYSEQMLFHELSRKFKNRINFLYLPIDPYNECNMGYAFVNFVHTRHIRPFLEEFNGRRWSRFNSGKICELAYARIQGTNSLISHFENARPAASRWKARNQTHQGRLPGHHLSTSA